MKAKECHGEPHKFGIDILRGLSSRPFDVDIQTLSMESAQLGNTVVFVTPDRLVKYEPEGLEICDSVGFSSRIEHPLQQRRVDGHWECLKAQ
jgi:hypothetical protein